MKVSDIYKLPMAAEENNVFSDDCRYSIRTDHSDMNCNEQAKLIAVALNHHDELVEAINESNNMLTNFTEHGFVRELIKRNFELLDKIKGK